MANQTLVDYVIGMQSAGMTDSEIINRLRDEGYNAKDVNDSMNQAKIKATISSQPSPEEGGYQNMSPSITEGEENIPVPSPIPKTSEAYRKKEPSPQQPQYAEPYQQTYQYPESRQMEQIPAQPKIETEYVHEIAEEIINEKWRDFRKKIGPIEDFKGEMEKRVSEVENKTEKIEEMMNKMQISILGKIQEYGRSIESVGTEVRAIESNIGKMIDPLVSNLKELKKKKEN